MPGALKALNLLGGSESYQDLHAPTWQGPHTGMNITGVANPWLYGGTGRVSVSGPNPSPLANVPKTSVPVSTSPVTTPLPTPAPTDSNTPYTGGSITI